MEVEHSIPEKVIKHSVHTPSDTAMKYFFYATSVGHFAAVSDYFVRRKDYNLLLLGYTVCGEGILEYGGQKYRLKQGDLFIIDCNQYQHYRTNGEIWDFYWVHVGGAAAMGYYKLIAENNGNVFRFSNEFIGLWQRILILCQPKGWNVSRQSLLRYMSF